MSRLRHLSLRELLACEKSCEQHIATLEAQFAAQVRTYEIAWNNAQERLRHIRLHKADRVAEIVTDTTQPAGRQAVINARKGY